MNRRLYCPPPAWRLIATALKCEFLKEYGKLPCKVGSNSYIQDYLLMVDRRCYENRGHKMHLPLRLPEKKKKKSRLQHKLQINHFPPTPCLRGYKSISHTSLHARRDVCVAAASTTPVICLRRGSLGTATAPRTVLAPKSAMARAPEQSRLGCNPTHQEGFETPWIGK